VGAAASVSEDQDKLLTEAKKQVDKNGFEMKSSLVSDTGGHEPAVVRVLSNRNTC